MRNVVLARIDERMLHGQVCTKWMQATHANVIVLADDDLVNDKFTCKIFMGMKPAGTELQILTVDQAIAYLKEESPANERIMLLTKCAQSFLRMKEQPLPPGTDWPQVLRFQGYTIEYGIAAAEFEIGWYRRLLSELEEQP